MNQLQFLRDRIAALQDEQKELQEQRRSRTEVEAWVRRSAAEWAERGAREARRKLIACAHGQSHGWLEAPTTLGGESVDLADFFAVMLGADRVADVLLANIDAVPEGLDRQERAARLAEIQAELDHLERAEEDLITEAELNGVDVARRGNARAEIVLAVIE